MEKKVRNGNTYCQKCGHKLQKYGLYKNGSQKRYCPHCHSYLKIGKNHKKKQKIKLCCSNTLNILPIQRKCLNMDVIDRHFEGTLRYLKISISLFLIQKIDICYLS